AGRSVTPLAHHPNRPRPPDPRPRAAAGRSSGTRGSARSGLVRASARCAGHLIILARPSGGRESVAVREMTVQGGVPSLDGYFRTREKLLTRRGVLWLGQTCHIRCHFCSFLDPVEQKDHPRQPVLDLRT